MKLDVNEKVGGKRSTRTSICWGRINNFYVIMLCHDFAEVCIQKFSWIDLKMDHQNYVIFDNAKMF